MKRKILSYLLVWLLTLFIWWCFTYVEATWGGNSTQEEVLWAGWWSSDWWWDWSVNLSEGNGVNPDWWRTATTPPPSGTAPTSTQTQSSCPNWCCWIKLNTNFPIIWNCIETKADKTNPTNAFPYMIWALTKIIMSVILVVCFILVIVAGIMRAADKPKEWKELLKKVAIAILLLWFSWVILRLINPNFFS